jgi:hypothetical protein
MLSMYAEENQRDWDVAIPMVTFAYNRSHQATTGKTPFFLPYGREAVMPFDAAIGADQNPRWRSDSIDSDRSYLLSRLQLARRQVREKLAVAQPQQKEENDRRLRDA